MLRKEEFPKEPYQAGLRPLRKEYPEQCHPSNKLVEAFKRYSRACWELL